MGVASITLFVLGGLAAVLVGGQLLRRGRPPEEALLIGSIATMVATGLALPLSDRGLVLCLGLSTIYLLGGLLHLRLMWPDMAWISLLAVLAAAASAALALLW